MELSEEARERLADVVELQPTKNGELADRWDMAGGSEVHQFLESELGDWYYRDEDSLIRATPAAVDLVEGKGEGADRTVAVSELEGAVVEVVPDADAEPQSVVATLHALRDDGRDPPVDDVRSALRGLQDKGIVEHVQRTVPTFRLAVAREDLALDVADA